MNGQQYSPPIHRVKDPVFKLTMSIYPVCKCGAELQEGSPLKVTIEGTDLYELKSDCSRLILESMKMSSCDGDCFVEMLVTKNGQYHDRDDWWAKVNVAENKVIMEDIND